ncbi:MAG: hypothetical protein Q8S73_43890 [Deltaproteobacteria bacterium]|nr:hypothetical protein [Myxococcales bacterium]MDP3221106.1 hypothetical protein [Deltaproteobacteria bacterium]
MPIAWTYRGVSGLSADDFHFLADRYDDTYGWSEDMAESWIGRVVRGQMYLLLGHRGWLTRLWRAPSGRAWASEGGMRPGVHVETSGELLTPQWSFTPLPGVLSGVYGLDESNVFAFGQRVQSPGIHGIVHRWDGSRWAETPPPPGLFLGMHGLRPDLVYAVGDGGIVARWDGLQWVRVPAPTRAVLSSVQVVSEDEIHACGAGYRVLEGSVHGWAERIIADGPLLSLGVFQGKVLVTTGSRGIHAVEGNRLVEWAKDVPATQLDARGDLLAACPDELVATRDGETFTRIPIGVFREATSAFVPAWKAGRQRRQR